MTASRTAVVTAKSSEPVWRGMTAHDASVLFAIETGVTYLNAASVGPLPSTTRAALNVMYDVGVRQPWRTDDLLALAFEKSRRLAAELIDAPVEDVMYAYNTGHGVNIAAFGLPFERGDEILLSAVDFPSNVYPWLALREQGVKVTLVPAVNGRFSFDELVKALTPRVKAIAVSFVQFHDGYKLPLERIHDLAKSAGAFFVVDGIQGCGVEPISVRELGIDIFTAGAQKWLLSPLGIGIVSVSESVRGVMRPVARGWLSAEWADFFDLFQYDKTLFPDARRFSFGTAPAAHLAALAESLELLVCVGVENIQRHTHTLIDQLVSGLFGDRRLRVTSEMSREARSSIFTFTCDDYIRLHEALLAARVICVRREGSIRIAPHLYNTSEDIGRVVEITRSFLAH